jgi:hypothetical protein
MVKNFAGVLFFVSGLWGQTQQVSYADAIVPQMPVGCGWTATIILVNLTSRDVQFAVNFWPQEGRIDPNAMPAPRVIPIVGLGPVGSVSNKLPANGSYTIKVDESARDSTTGCNGWAEVNSDEAIGGHVLLNQKLTVQTQEAIGGILVQQTTEFQFETTVPISSRFANHFIVPFDATSFTSAIAIVNPSFQVGADVTIRYRDNAGNLICTETRSLNPGEEQAFALASPSPYPMNTGGPPPVCGFPPYQDLQGKSGVAEFLTSNLEFSGFGLRFGQLGFVSYPAQSPIGQ